MKKILIALLLCPMLVNAQSKSDWTFYGPNFSYEKGNVLPLGLTITAINQVLFTKDGAMVISSEGNPIVFFKDGKDYNTGGILFTKEKAKVSLMKGGETNSALAMLIDDKNDLWFGTKKGLYKIPYAIYSDLEKMQKQSSTDGVKISDETPGMPFNAVSQIKQGSNGNIWVSGGKSAGLVKFEYKGVSVYDGTQWKNYPVTTADGKEVTRLILDSQDNPVVVSEIGFQNQTVSWFKDGQWKSLGAPVKNENVEALAFDKNNTLYAAAMNGIFTWKNDKWEKVETKKETRYIKDIKFDSKNNLWVATDYGVVCVNSGAGEYDLTATNSPLPVNLVKRVVIDSNDRKWFVTDAGIAGFKEPQDLGNENMKVYTRFNSGMFDGKIESMVPFKDGFLLVNYDYGLVRYDGKAFSNITPNDQKELYYSDVAVDKNGVAYVSTYRYLHKYDGTTYSKWDWKDDIGKQVNTVLVDDKNTVWIGFNGISKFNGTAWENFDKKNAGLSSNSILQLFQDSKKNIWAVLPDGVAKYDGTTWTSFTKKTTGVQFRNMTGVAETKDGKILFTNGFTLAQYDGTNMSAVAGFKEVGTVRNMLVDDDGTLIMATEENGIAKFKDGAVTYCNQNTCGIPNNAINYVYKHTDGKIWISFGQKPYALTPDPAEKPSDTFQKKIKLFDSFFGLAEISKL
jgi:ligand-binding sensor domain-containing protein